MTFAMVMVILFVENVFVIQDGMYIAVIYIVISISLFYFRFGRRCECGSGNASSTVENCPYVY